MCNISKNTTHPVCIEQQQSIQRRMSYHQQQNAGRRRAIIPDHRRGRKLQHEWRHHDVVHLISLVQQHRGLWDVRSVDYKQTRLSAWRQVIEELDINDVDIAEAKLKWMNLRLAFKTNYQKLRRRRFAEKGNNGQDRSAVDPDGLVRWKYYKLLTFLEDDNSGENDEDEMDGRGKQWMTRSRGRPRACTTAAVTLVPTQNLLPSKDDPLLHLGEEFQILVPPGTNEEVDEHSRGMTIASTVTSLPSVNNLPNDGDPLLQIHETFRTLAPAEASDERSRGMTIASTVTSLPSVNNLPNDGDPLLQIHETFRTLPPAETSNERPPNFGHQSHTYMETQASIQPNPVNPPTPSPITQLPTTPPSGRLKDMANEVLTSALNTLDKINDPHTIFGDFIASELRELPPAVSQRLRVALMRTVTAFWEDRLAPIGSVCAGNSAMGGHWQNPH